MHLHLRLARSGDYSTFAGSRGKCIFNKDLWTLKEEDAMRYAMALTSCSGGDPGDGEPPICCLVLEDKDTGNIIGAMAFTYREIKAIHIKEEYRRQGYARFLMSAAVTYSKGESPEGDRYIGVLATKISEPFFQKMGFVLGKKSVLERPAFFGPRHQGGLMKDAFVSFIDVQKCAEELGASIDPFFMELLQQRRADPEERHFISQGSRYRAHRAIYIKINEDLGVHIGGDSRPHGAKFLSTPFGLFPAGSTYTNPYALNLQGRAPTIEETNFTEDFKMIFTYLLTISLIQYRSRLTAKVLLSAKVLDRQALDDYSQRVSDPCITQTFAILNTLTMVMYGACADTIDSEARLRTFLQNFKTSYEAYETKAPSAESTDIITLVHENIVTLVCGLTIHGIENLQVDALRQAVIILLCHAATELDSHIAGMVNALLTSEEPSPKPSSSFGITS